MRDIAASVGVTGRTVVADLIRFLEGHDGATGS